MKFRFLVIPFVAIVLGACGNEESVEENNVVDPLASVQATEVSNTEVKRDNTDAEKKAYQIIRDSLGEYFDIEFNRTERVYVFIPKEELQSAITTIYTTGAGIQSWYDLVESFQISSIASTKLLGEGYYFQIVNASNTDRTLLLISDGEVKYDFLDY